MYKGQPIPTGEVSLAQPEPVTLAALLSEADLTEHERGWYGRAESDASILYFCILQDGRPTGQIMLHDIDEAAREALIGYHIFRRSDRGRGIGTLALGAVRDYAFAHLNLRRLVIITTLDNAASRRIAEKCGFIETGPAREGPELVVYEQVP